MCVGRAEVNRKHKLFAAAAFIHQWYEQIVGAFVVDSYGCKVMWNVPLFGYTSNIVNTIAQGVKVATHFRCMVNEFAFVNE